MKIKITYHPLLLLLISLIPVYGYVQEIKIKNFTDQYRGKEAVRIVFYNVENLFDIYDDSTKNDNEFLPNKKKQWDNYKYYDKLKKIGKTLIAAGGWEAPSVIGLAEIENRKVLEDLVSKTPLSNYNYRIVHAESPDKRGIDVAYLIRPSKVEVLNWKLLRIDLQSSYSKTRDISYLKALILEKDTVHFFLNHWPSRYGGVKKSEPKRILTAQTLRSEIDSIQELVHDANILIMGDFNDYHYNTSLSETLSAKTSIENVNEKDLINLMYPTFKETGTHKYQGKWHILDMFIISQSLLKPNNKVFTNYQSVVIFNAPWLLESDTKNVGSKPKRTYYGPQYHGGFSDHLPIIIDLHLNSQ